MRAYVTLDYWDGTKSKVREVEIDAVDMKSLIFELMVADVAGFTVTKKIDPMKFQEKMNLKIDD